MKTRTVPARRAILLAGSLALLGLVGASPTDGALRPLLDASISLSPGSGPPGTTVTVTGSGFPSQSSGAITWGSGSGNVIGSFSANANGAFSTSIKVPEGASGGTKVWACTMPKLLIAGPICASRSFKVTEVVEEPEVTLVPVVPRLPTPVRTVCDERHIAGEVVVDFERMAEGESLRGVTTPEGVRFVGDTDLRVFSPAVDTHSGTRALRMDYAGEFGSGGAMMRISFVNVQDFVGMYVGLNERIWAASPITAVLTAYAYDASGISVAVGSDSVSFGPAATPIRKCLSVLAPGIYEVTLTYGGAGEPEVIDDLVLRGPATPVPVPEDDQPPEVTIQMPEDGVRMTDTRIRLQGEVREDRELAELQYRVNLGEFHNLVFTPAGFTPEGDHLYLFAIEPLRASELRTCGDNLVDVVARDMAGNEGMDAHAFPMYVGDLEVLEVDPVQVMYGADLVREKSTAFRVRVRSTFECPVQTYFRLELPEDQWSTAPPQTGNHHTDMPSSWEYPDTWGLVEIPTAAADHVVMLPYIPAGEENAAFDTGHPAGLIVGRLVGGVEGPDVRVVPRPIAESVTFAVEVDPANSWPEQDEGNNRFDSPAYPVVTTRSMCFYVVPIQSGGMGPVTSALNIKPQVEFLLATFPLADAKVSWKTAPVNAQTCTGFYAGQDCNWAITDGGDFLGIAAADAALANCDYAIAVGPWGGGSTPLNYMGGAVIGDGGGEDLLAHEFSHSSVGVQDIYSLDCLVDWDELYCEFPDGHRLYFCQSDALDKPNDYVGANCSCATPVDNLCSSDVIDCPTEEKSCDLITGCSVFRRTDACKPTSVPSCDGVCARATAAPLCSGAIGTWAGPDCRIRHHTPEGFWVNRWERREPGLAYIMDCNAPRSWMRLDNAVNHCQPGVAYADGFRNMLTDPDFITGEDPEVLLVRGTIHRDGSVELLPFVRLSEANLSRAPGAPGDYRIVLYDAQGAVLAQTGFEVSFEGTGISPGPKEASSFALRVEWMPGTALVGLQDLSGTQVAEVRVTANSPRVDVLTPNGGETWEVGQKRTVRWEAHDADGDALTFFVEVSPDAGATWWPVGVDLKDKDYRLETGMFSAGKDFLIRVRASDGVNTSSDISDAPFTLADRGPATAPYGLLGVLVVLGAAGLALIWVGAKRIRDGRRLP